MTDRITQARKLLLQPYAWRWLLLALALGLIAACVGCWILQPPPLVPPAPITRAPTLTPTLFPSRTLTWTPTSTSLSAPSPTATFTPSFTATQTATSSPTVTDTPSPSFTATDAPTNSPTPIDTIVPGRDLTPVLGTATPTPVSGTLPHAGGTPGASDAWLVIGAVILLALGALAWDVAERTKGAAWE